MKTYRERAIVLRTYNLGEADRIVVMLGQNAGQIRGVAKGVRKPSSRFGARLSPFNLVDVQMHRGRNLDTVTQAQLLAGYGAQIGADFASFTAAKVVVETTQKLSEDTGEVDQTIFPLLHGALAAIASKRELPDLLAASFLLRSMAASGWPAGGEVCGACGTNLASNFDPAGAGFVCESCVGQTGWRVDPGTPKLATALAAGQWGEAEGSSLNRTQVLKAATKWAEWNLEQRLKTMPYLEAETT